MLSRSPKRTKTNHQTNPHTMSFAGFIFAVVLLHLVVGFGMILYKIMHKPSSKLVFWGLLSVGTAAYAQQPGVVQHVGAMQEMAQRNFAPSVQLDTLMPRKHLYGIGPFGRMQGEITVLDGRPYVAIAPEPGVATVQERWDASAPFFVWAVVEKWKTYPLKEEILTLAALEKAIEKLAQQHGLDLSKPFPFRVRGAFESMTTHIVTPRSSEVPGYRPDVKQENYDLNGVKGELLGFYSQQHQGVFTHKDSFIHVHFVEQDRKQMGHVDKIQLPATSLQVLLPILASK